jgi:hypothetical protein
MRTKTFTGMPRRYVTGGVQAKNAAMMLRDLAAHPDLSAFEAGGPIDATDHVPTGRLFIAHGVRFFELGSRPEA